MRSVKILTDYDFTYGYHCPCCGEFLDDFTPVNVKNQKSIPMIKFNQFEVICEKCNTKIEYMKMTKR